MRNHRNHTIVNAANVGNSIRVAGRTMRSLRVKNPVRFYFTSAQRLTALGQRPCTDSQRCPANLRWEKSDRTPGQERDSFLMCGGLRFAG